MAGPPPPLMEIKLIRREIFFSPKTPKNTKTAVSWSFFGAQGKVNTPFFWKLAANEFLLQYFFCRMSGRGEKKSKTVKKI